MVCGLASSTSPSRLNILDDSPALAGLFFIYIKLICEIFGNHLLGFNFLPNIILKIKFNNKKLWGGGGNLNSV